MTERLFPHNPFPYSVYGYMHPLLSCDSRYFVEPLSAIRRDATRFHALMTGYQKSCGRQEAEIARYFRECAKEAMKSYRAACLLLGYFMADPPGDCHHRPTTLWPEELSPYLDQVLGWADINANPYRLEEPA